MRRLFLTAAAFALSLATPLLASAQEDPAALLQKLADLDNAKDQPGLVGLFAPDGVIVSPSPDSMDQTKTYTSTDQISQWVKGDVASPEAEDDKVELGEITVNGDTASAPFKSYTNDPQMQQAGLDPITGVTTATVKDGKITKFTITLDEAWMQKASAAMSAAQGSQAAPTAAGPGQLPNTGAATDPLLPRLALAAGLGLLAIGVAVRRTRRAA